MREFYKRVLLIRKCTLLGIDASYYLQRLIRPKIVNYDLVIPERRNVKNWFKYLTCKLGVCLSVHRCICVENKTN